MLTVRPSRERGLTKLDWLTSYHTFSFADYFDPDHMGFRTLRVINDDVVAPGQGFGMHPHRDMEIITVVLDGAIEHSDSMGHTERLRPGEVQVMSAGRGVLHSEFNPSPTDPLHLLQIWIVPERRGLTPVYQQKEFSPAERNGVLRRVAGRDGVERDGALHINQDANLFLGHVEQGQALEHALATGRSAWLHLARGAVTVNGLALQAGDGLAIESESRLAITGAADKSDLLLFDLA